MTTRFAVPIGLLVVLTFGWLSPTDARRGRQWKTADIKKENFDGTPVSGVIFGEQQLPIEFSHADHLKDKMGCVFCHEDAEESRSSLDNLIPGHDVCDICHDIDRDEPEKKVEEGEPRADCVACHIGYDPKKDEVARVVIPPPNLKFNHAVHAENKVDCRTCHGQFEEQGVVLATRAQLPKMSLCLQCHDDATAPAACTTCHLAEAGGVVKMDFPEGKLAPSGVLRGAIHDTNFRTSHAVVARNDAEYCETCHKKDFCVGCHNGVMKPLDFHGNDYIALHPVEARRNNPDCSACHRLQTFCVGCHSRSGVASDSIVSEFRGSVLQGDGPRFHPEGWNEFGNRGPNHHSFQAQKNIKQCASCHREQFCIGCHGGTTPTFRQNPHPPGWAGSRRCRNLLSRAGRMCQRCHTDPRDVTCDPR